MIIGRFLNKFKSAFLSNSTEPKTTLELPQSSEVPLQKNRDQPETTIYITGEQNHDLPSTSEADLITSSEAAAPDVFNELHTPEAMLVTSAEPPMETLSNSEQLTNNATILANVIEDKIMINTSMLQEVLQNFVSGSADVQGAALVSPDGLALASVLPGDMDEERTAAMSASMLSLGERIGRELARGNIDRIVVEGEKGYGVLVGCGSDAVLLVLANSTAKQGVLFLEVKRTVTQIAPLVA